jgi:acetyl esterase/lipase
MLINILFAIGILLGVLYLVARLALRGRPHEAYDSPKPTITGQRTEPSTEHLEATKAMASGFANSTATDRKQMLATMREQMDDLGRDVSFAGTITMVEFDGMKAEWVLSPNANPDHRLLYIHGGSWTAGSPLSHRAITTEFARRLDVAVLAIDYRLIPEHTRLNCVEDCQAAYRWIIENGPNGLAPAESLLVSGDSAGGNLALILVAWARDQGLRAADAAIALSPATDASFTSPTLAANVDTDAMLGPILGKSILGIPNWLLLWGLWFENKVVPTNPLISPLHGSLQELPPTLLHASTAEMLEGDSVRYYNKAMSQGSPVEIGTWPFMLHAWHLFVREQPEAQEAFDHIETFVRKHVAAIQSA